MELEAALYKYFTYRSFRPLQKEIIETILSGQDTVALLPTGAGKSICFQLPALLMPGLTIVISPLIALMQDQVDSLLRRNIPATYISSTLSHTEVVQRIELLQLQKYKLLYIAPERLQHKKFLILCKQLQVSCIIIDEAHCISEWGHDFRPPYLQIASFIAELPHRPVIAAFTATATKHTLQEITESLKLRSPKIYVASFYRSNLHISVIHTTSFQLQEIAVLLLLKKHQGESGIIYVSTRTAAQNVCEMIKKYLSNQVSVGFYHGELAAQQRQYIQKLFMANKIDVIVATSAFGMGVDKANISFVIHFHFPGSIEAYYQEIGRAGRGGQPAQCYLLFNEKNQDIHETLQSQITSPAAQTHKLQRLEAMLAYTYTKKCRMQMILDYFNEQKSSKCNNCDSCIQPQFAQQPFFSALVSKKQCNEIQALHAWRLQLQKAHALSHYAEVLTDTQLLLAYVIQPNSEADFAKIPGCGRGWKIRWASHFLLKSDKIQV